MAKAIDAGRSGSNVNTQQRIKNNGQRVKRPTSTEIKYTLCASRCRFTKTMKQSISWIYVPPIWAEAHVFAEWLKQVWKIQIFSSSRECACFVPLLALNPNLTRFRFRPFSACLLVSHKECPLWRSIGTKWTYCKGRVFSFMHINLTEGNWFYMFDQFL